MAVGFITRRGGVSSEQALAPTITFVSKTESQIVFTIKNNDTSTAVILWELDDATPDANSFELTADTTSSNITVTGLILNTEYDVYATANVTGKVKSNVSELAITTDSIIYAAATGGTIEEYNESGKRYRSHTFTSSGNFVVNTLGSTPELNQVDYLIIAGGASGGADIGGGGGAGGYRTTIIPTPENTAPNLKPIITIQSYEIVVGAGGSPVSGTGIGSGNNGNNGSNSSALGITSTGGGGGAHYTRFNTPPPGNNGGSGGGGNRSDDVASVGGQGISGQGRNGGNGGNQFFSGGGGGAGQAGVNGTTAGQAGTGGGGDGLSNTLRNGTSETRAGGGGGGTSSSSGAGAGGAGGGGAGANGNNGSNATVNTGSGGGGAGYNLKTSGAGGSGIVIIRYEIALIA